MIGAIFRRPVMLVAIACLLVLCSQADARGARPTILAAGDSQMQSIYQFLFRSLVVPDRARVVYDAHPSTGIANPYLFSWVRHARAMAWSVHPDATAVFLGANDSFPLGRAQCCGHLWVVRYAVRIKRMIRSYRRHGMGRVYWFTFPTPSSPFFRRVARGVNQAIARAAKALPQDVTVVDLRPAVPVNAGFREPDGVHLTPTGYRIAASLLIRAMRRDGVLRLRSRT